jgi:hypothetical protein
LLQNDDEIGGGTSDKVDALCSDEDAFPSDDDVMESDEDSMETSLNEGDERLHAVKESTASELKICSS